MYSFVSIILLVLKKKTKKSHKQIKTSQDKNVVAIEKKKCRSFGRSNVMAIGGGFVKKEKMGIWERNLGLKTKDSNPRDTHQSTKPVL